MEIDEAIEKLREVFPGAEWVEEPVKLSQMRAWIGDRMKVIAGNEAAKKLVIQHWPKDAGKPSEVTVEQLDAVIRLLDEAESRAGIPFGATDPRAPLSGHKNDARQLRPVVDDTHASATEHATGSQTMKEVSK